jgi:hypothetical protein
MTIDEIKDAQNASIRTKNTIHSVTRDNVADALDLVADEILLPADGSGNAVADVTANLNGHTLTINGDLAITDGNQAADYVFTSDADGKGTWKPVASLQKVWERDPTAAPNINTNTQEFEIRGTDGTNVASLNLGVSSGANLVYTSSGFGANINLSNTAASLIVVANGGVTSGSMEINADGSILFSTNGKFLIATPGAITGGVATGQLYMTGDFVKMVH